MKMRLLLGFLIISASFILTSSGSTPVTIMNFYGDLGHTIHFTPEDSTRYDTEDIRAEDKGRVAVMDAWFPNWSESSRVFATVYLNPIAKDSLTVWDKWDRAGSIRLSKPGQADLELAKFITPYGGDVSFEIDLTHLKPYLTREGELKAFIDTWSSPGWKIQLNICKFSLKGDKSKIDSLPSDWVLPLIYEEAVTAVHQPEPVHVSIPEGTYRTELYYLVSGHCTDGTNADEFESKFNVVKVDGREVLRYKPWRNDCTDFRDINPFTRHWPDGTWSSDYSRSGWCPGDWVRPMVTDLRMDLLPGDHTMEFSIEDVRPRDENDHYGYWRVSAYLVGWKE